jgi:hypothetical protein
MDEQSKKPQSKQENEQAFRNEALELDPGIGISVSRNYTDASLVDYERVRENKEK